MTSNFVTPGNPGAEFAAEFAAKFGPEHGPELFEMGISLEHAERIFQMSLTSGLSFAMSRAALAQNVPAN